MNHQHPEALCVTFTQEFANIIGLLQRIEEVFTQKNLPRQNTHQKIVSKIKMEKNYNNKGKMNQEAKIWMIFITPLWQLMRSIKDVTKCKNQSNWLSILIKSQNKHNIKGKSHSSQWTNIRYILVPNISTPQFPPLSKNPLQVMVVKNV